MVDSEVAEEALEAVWVDSEVDAELPGVVAEEEVVVPTVPPRLRMMELMEAVSQS